MDIGISIVTTLIALVCRILAMVAEAIMEVVPTVVSGMADLMVAVLELGLYVAFWIASPFLSEKPKHRKLPEKFRLVFRRVVQASLVIGAGYGLAYGLWLRNTAPQTPPSATLPPPTKIEKVRQVFQKAKQIKETLLPPKPEP